MNKMDEGRDIKTGKQSERRRTFIKALMGVPVLGLLGFKIIQNINYSKERKDVILDKLGLNEIQASNTLQETPTNKKRSLLRIGIIGFGDRAQDLAKGLGCMSPKIVKQIEANGNFDDIINQENLNVSITGICDVFNDNAAIGILTAQTIYPGKEPESKILAKRYMHYQDMLNDDNIDAVIIATPEHLHAKMTIDALKAKKHVYCEKSFTRTEEEANQTYEALMNSQTVFQLGHQGAHTASNKKAKEIIEKGILGKISIIEVTSNRNTADGAWLRHIDKDGKLKPGTEASIDWEQWLGDRPKVPFSVDRFYNWTKWFDYSTGLLGQLFTHDYFELNYLLELGIPHSAVASGGVYYWKDNRDIPDVLQVAFEYPDRDLTLLYSATLSSSRNRGNVIMGHDGWMKIGGKAEVTIDSESTRFREEINSGEIATDEPLISYSGSDNIDAITSATSKYYADRGLSQTVVKGKMIDPTYLHLKEWIDCIHNGDEPSAGNPDRIYEESIIVQMAHKAFTEKRYVTWDPENRRID